MSRAISARVIRNIPWGGAATQGQFILFDLQFNDGTSEKYACPISVVPLLVGNIRQYTSMADTVRIKGPDYSVIEAAPYRATDVFRSGHAADGSIVSVEYNTTHGFPVSIAMTPDQARRSIEFLQRELLLALQPPLPGGIH
jgi:hypothetical protein